MKSNITLPRDQHIFKTPSQRVEEALTRLEGSIEGIKIFYPGLGQYMMEQVDTLYRTMVLPGSKDTVLEYFAGKVPKRKYKRKK